MRIYSTADVIALATDHRHSGPWVRAADLRDIAHAARMHYEFLRKQEGTLPAGERQIMADALDLELRGGY